MIIIATAATLVVLLLGFTLGYVARPFLCKNDIDAVFMNRIVNQEAAEERRNQTRLMLHDAKRRTMRLDGGKPAQVHQMRRRRRMYRDPL